MSRSTRDAPEFVTRRKLAETLNVSLDTVGKFTHDETDPLPHYKIGRRHLFRMSEVLEWLRRQAERS